MPNVAQVLKQEISRLARREARQECAQLHKQIRGLRDTVSKQKATIDRLDKTIARLKVQETKTSKTTHPPVEAEEETRVRMTSASIKRLRGKLGISQAQMGRLLRVSTNTIVRWEAGSSTPRNRHKLAFAELRSAGKREIKKRLAEEKEEEPQE